MKTLTCSLGERKHSLIQFPYDIFPLLKRFHKFYRNYYFIGSKTAINFFEVMILQLCFYVFLSNIANWLFSFGI